MKHVTEQQFKNFRKEMYRRFDHIFLRLDQQDDMIGVLFTKIDRMNENMERNIARYDKSIARLEETNAKMDARIASLEDWRMSPQH